MKQVFNFIFSVIITILFNACNSKDSEEVDRKSPAYLKASIYPLHILADNYKVHKTDPTIKNGRTANFNFYWDYIEVYAEFGVDVEQSLKYVVCVAKQKNTKTLIEKGYFASVNESQSGYSHRIALVHFNQDLISYNINCIVYDNADKKVGFLSNFSILGKTKYFKIIESSEQTSQIYTSKVK
jgi:hypothetical protein